MVKTWTEADIRQLLCNSDAAAERAMIALRDEKVTLRSTDVAAATHFAQWLLGLNSQNNQVYEKKNLNHQKALKRYARFCRKGERPIDRARRISLNYCEELADIANRKAQSVSRSQPVATQGAYEQLTLKDWADSKFTLTKEELGLKPVLTNEQLAAEISARSGAVGGDQEEIYERMLAQLEEEDKMKDSESDEDDTFDLDALKAFMKTRCGLSK